MKHSNIVSRILNSVFGVQSGLYWIFVAVLLVPNLLLIMTEPYSLLTSLSSIILPAGVYMLFIGAFPKPGIGALIAVPMMILCAFQLVIMYLFGGSIIAVDMFTNLLTTNASEAGELLGSIMPAIVGVCVLYIPAIIFAIISIRKKDKLYPEVRKRKLRYGTIVTIVGILLTVVAEWTNPLFGVKYQIFPVNVLYNLDLTIKQWNKSLAYPETSAGFRFGSVRTDSVAGPEVYVLVVGEASRAHSWSMFGYNRPTTVAIDTVKGIVPFYDVFTQNNATHKSVPLILSPIDATNFNDIYSQKSLIAAFSEVGFKTLYISNQVPNRSMIDYFGDEADERINLRQGGGISLANHPDTDMLPYIKEAVDKNSGKLLIVLHTYGSHFNFKERYPAEAAIFFPDAISSVDIENRDVMMNAYDNSVAYTAGFLKDIINILQASKQTSALLYSSDHGEDIMDDSRERFLHASPTPTYYQLHVASFAWFSNAYALHFLDKVEAARANSHSSAMTSMVFHTILDMASIRNNYVDTTTSLVSNGFTVRPKIYLNDHYEPMDLYDIGLQPLDYEMFDKRNIYYDKDEIYQIQY